MRIVSHLLGHTSTQGCIATTIPTSYITALKWENDTTRWPEWTTEVWCFRDGYYGSRYIGVCALIAEKLALREPQNSLSVSGSWYMIGYELHYISKMGPRAEAALHLKFQDTGWEREREGEPERRKRRRRKKEIRFNLQAPYKCLRQFSCLKQKPLRGRGKREKQRAEK